MLKAMSAPFSYCLLLLVSKSSWLWCLRQVISLLLAPFLILQSPNLPEIGGKAQTPYCHNTQSSPRAKDRSQQATSKDSIASFDSPLRIAYAILTLCHLFQLHLTFFCLLLQKLFLNFQLPIQLLIKLEDVLACFFYYRFLNFCSFLFKNRPDGFYFTNSV